MGYGFASGVALLVDTGLLLYLVRYCLFRPAAAASLSFAAGAVVAYLLSVKLVFSAHRMRSRRIEFSIFCALGLVGLAVNVGVIAFGTWLGANLWLAKACAAGATFCCNFFLRKQILFTLPEQARQTSHAFAE